MIVVAVEGSWAPEMGGCWRSTDVTIIVPGASWRVGFLTGGLIQTAVGRSAGRGGPLTNRSVWAAYAAARVTSRSDEHAPQMRIASFGNRPRACFVPPECSDGTRPTNAIARGAEPKRRAPSSSAAIVNAVRSSMMAKTPQPRDARSQRFEGEQLREAMTRAEEGRPGYPRGSAADHAPLLPVRFTALSSRKRMRISCVVARMVLVRAVRSS